jgi:hypothetical protein
LQRNGEGGEGEGEGTGGGKERPEGAEVGAVVRAKAEGGRRWRRLQQR